MNNRTFMNSGVAIAGSVIFLGISALAMTSTQAQVVGFALVIIVACFWYKRKIEGIYNDVAVARCDFLKESKVLKVLWKGNFALAATSIVAGGMGAMGWMQDHFVGGRLLLFDDHVGALCHMAYSAMSGSLLVLALSLFLTMCYIARLVPTIES